MEKYKLQNIQDWESGGNPTCSREGRLKGKQRGSQEIGIQMFQGDKICTGNDAIERTDHFTFLGSLMSVTGGTEEDIVARIRKAQQDWLESESYLSQDQAQNIQLQREIGATLWDWNLAFDKRAVL